MFVGQIPRSMDEADLTKMFSEYGRVYNINVLRDKVTGQSKGYVPSSIVSKTSIGIRSYRTSNKNSGGGSGNGGGGESGGGSESGEENGGGGESGDESGGGGEKVGGGKSGGGHESGGGGEYGG
ncbi:hypothetical protein M8J77_015456 [Diaphorina citri]|nr:hypothetical protein M8J77_015456 [Diaphorina citri]